jgi:gliding motility-associated-like protein
MKKIFSSILLIFISSLTLKAAHITGGEIIYNYVQLMPNGNHQYSITLKLYRDCHSTGAQLDLNAPIAIFNNGSNTSFWSGLVPRSNVETLNLSTPGPCITNAPEVCYQVGFYTFTIELPPTAFGYTVAYQRCCRISGINNIINPGQTGATFTAQIPGTNALATAPANNSAKFIGADTVVICADFNFTYNFGAVDVDGDSLRYAFCEAYEGGSTQAPAPNPPFNPPYNPVSYASPFSSTSPLGSFVKINPATGLVSGLAPSSGIYVLTVCVSEFRNGVLIATQRKDLQIKVAACTIAAASLDPEYLTCDGFNLSFSNKVSSPLIKTYFWDFGVASMTSDTSNLANPTFNFPDTGVYVIKLVTNRNQECSDSTTALAKVYPGFFPGFSTSGICVTTPSNFFDTTLTNYGFVNSWSWDFGDLLTNTDTSTQKNPSYQYTQSGNKTVRLTVSNSKGCIKTITKDILIIDKPPITLAFKDTLLCGDSVRLQASGNGNFTWTPLLNIIDPATPNPIVFPPSDRKYYVDLDDSGCKNRDSVNVRVVNTVTLAARPDTVICLTDPVQIGVNSNGLLYSWTPSATLNNPNAKNPIATPLANTTYRVTATIGRCSASDQLSVRVVPYPGSNAGTDTVICFNTAAQLNGSIVGSSYSWSPVASLNNFRILNPVARPTVTTRYILTVRDTLGCPKSGRDTVLVIVQPKVNAFAGRDTVVVVGQPLQLNASGGISYSWSPPTGLSATNIGNPISLLDGSIDSIRYRVLVSDENGCTDSASILVRVFQTNPTIFVPTAFTPNNDGKNDLFRIVSVGMKKINYFRIFNRWGQLVFSTTTDSKGWDGKINGKDQSAATYVWIVYGMDYLDKPFFRKGTVTLIR